MNSRIFASNGPVDRCLKIIERKPKPCLRTAYKKTPHRTRLQTLLTKVQIRLLKYLVNQLNQ